MLLFIVNREPRRDFFLSNPIQAIMLMSGHCDRGRDESSSSTMRAAAAANGRKTLNFSFQHLLLPNHVPPYVNQILEASRIRHKEK